MVKNTIPSAGKSALKKRLSALKNDLSLLKEGIQFIDSKRQQTVNDILILTGRILELEEMLAEKTPGN